MSRVRDRTASDCAMLCFEWSWSAPGTLCRNDNIGIFPRSLLAFFRNSLLSQRPFVNDLIRISYSFLDQHGIFEVVKNNIQLFLNEFLKFVKAGWSPNRPRYHRSFANFPELQDTPSRTTPQYASNNGCRILFE